MLTRRELVTTNGKAKPCTLYCGTTLILIGVATIIWTPLYVVLYERLNMTPGFPAYNWWKSPPDTGLTKIYVFNITNREAFLSGEDPKLRVQEVGPIIFREEWRHSDVVFNENDTMTYTVTHRAIYLPELNDVDLNATLFVANTPILGALSYLWNTPFFTKFGINYLMRTLYSKTIIDVTVYDYLYNWTNPVIDVVNALVPSIIPINNIGLIELLYRNFTDRVTVYVGNAHGNERFLLMDRYDGGTAIRGREGSDCEGTIVNASEGLTFTQYMTKESVVKFYRKTMCRVIHLHYDSEMEISGIKTYKYGIRNNSYDRTDPIEDDCYRGHPQLPDGLSDVSKCNFGIPTACSFPHFLYSDPKLTASVVGLKPNATLHEAYTIVEPYTGVPLESAARSQGNLVINHLTGMDEMYDKFSDTVLPMFWIEHLHPELPGYLFNFVYLVATVLPIGQRVLTAALLILGAILLSAHVRRRAEEVAKSKKSEGLAKT